MIKTPRKCGSCQQPGHRRDNIACPNYQQTAISNTVNTRKRVVVEQVEQNRRAETIFLLKNILFCQKNRKQPRKWFNHYLISFRLF